MKRLVLSLTTAALVATVLGTGSGVAAAAEPANLNVTSGGVKKAEVTWDSSADPTATFDAYLVTADDDSDVAALAADRMRFVAQDAVDLSVVFDDLTAGQSYQFQLFAVDYTDSGVVVVPPDGGAAGAPLSSIVGVGATLTINTSAATVLTGSSVIVSGNLSGVANPSTVTLYYAPYPYNTGDWTSVSVSTDSNGNWTKSLPLTINTRFYALYEPTTGVGGWTRYVTVEVRKKISMAVAPSTTIPVGTTLKFSGKLQAVNVANLTGVKVYLQRLQGGVWGSIKEATLDEATGEYTVNFKPGVNGDGKYRVFSGMGPAYADSWSKAKSITVN